MNDTPQHTTLERVLDWAAALTAVGTLTHMLPSIAALFTIFWTGIRIYETRTVQGWLGRRPPPSTKGVEE